MLDKQRIMAFSGCGNSHLAQSVLVALNEMTGVKFSGIKLTHLDYSRFPDGEPDFFPVRDQQDQISGSHVLVFQSGHNLAFFDELKDLIFHSKERGASKITAIYFFMYGRRQDHGKRFPYKINRNLRYVKELKLAGLDNLILCDIHSQETVENCKNIGLNVINIDTSPVFAEYIMPYVNNIGRENFLVYSPDMGSAYRALSLARILDVSVMITPKCRSESGEVVIMKSRDFKSLLKNMFPNDFSRFVTYSNEVVDSKWIVMREDEISTGSTASMTGKKLLAMGANKLFFCATHPVCVDTWKRKMGLTDGNNPFDFIFFGNTIERGYEDRTGGIVTNVDMSRIIGGELFNLLLNS